MFTGIITALGHVRRIDPIGDGHDMRLVIDTPPPSWPNRRWRLVPRSPAPAAA